MPSTIKERDARFMLEINSATRAMREPLLERAIALALEFKRTREAMQEQIIRERRNQGRPDKASRGIYVAVGLTARIINKSVQLPWCRFHFNRHRQLTKRQIPKGLGPKYSLSPITTGVPYWIKDEIKRTEQRAALIRKQQVLIANLELAMRAVARGLATLDRDEGGRKPGPNPEGQSGPNGGGTPPVAESVPSWVAPTPRSEDEWCP